MLTVDKYLLESDPRHTDMVDAMAYAWAAQMAKIRDDYVLLYIKKKPWWIPEFLFKWFLGKLLVLNEFKK